MRTLHNALTQYVALRRALGTKLHEPARTLGHFVDFLKREGAEFITLGTSSSVGNGATRCATCDLGATA
jgi:hypothetical protein